MIQRELQNEIIQGLGGDVRLHVLSQHVERFGRKLARLSHTLECFRPVSLDSAISVRRAANFDVRHVLFLRASGQ